MRSLAITTLWRKRPCLRKTKLQSARRTPKKRNQRCAKGFLLFCKKCKQLFLASAFMLVSCFRKQRSNLLESCRTSSSTARVSILMALSTPETTRPSMRCHPSRRVKRSTSPRPQVNTHCITCPYCHVTHCTKKK